MSAPRLTPDQKNEIADAYQRGDRISLIAAKYGVDESYPGLLAKRRNLRPRNRSPWMTPAGGEIE